jgi:hypothetical protein
VTTEEPEWKLDDLRAALDWQAEQALICPGCGQFRDESMQHEETAPYYEVTSMRCHACAASQLVARDAADSHGSPPPGRYYAVTARPNPVQQLFVPVGVDGDSASQ